jgi:hypothetical protein
MKHPQNIAVVKSAFRSKASQANHDTAYPWPQKRRQLSANDVSEQITLVRVLGYTRARRTGANHRDYRASFQSDCNASVSIRMRWSHYY